ncbi:hypothetical protein QM588_10135 [Rhodococcus sp. IEGM 1354]|uniref:hypothetical protein n=1 Tax=Rhodococcus sp. IEGM 1354 TaxID=3047088 RepID=UPI0024B67C88|nr:hypothetical protein [Rhodococcus sp. IEGM 1354]MDI9930757.1 hypothetical protein [Rhodococcus sp. IEGM 1354]
MPTAREKQDSAFAAYQLAKDHEHALAGERGQSDPDVPLIVDHDDVEFHDAIEAEVSAQVALSAALRAVDD